MLCYHTATTASMTPPWRAQCPTWRARAWALSMPACSAWACSLNRSAFTYFLHALTWRACLHASPPHQYATLQHTSIFSERACWRSQIPLLSGFQGPPPWHPAPDEVKAACRRAAEYAEAHGSNISQLAIKWALQEESIATHLIGFSKPQQVHSISCHEDPYNFSPSSL